VVSSPTMRCSRCRRGWLVALRAWEMRLGGIDRMSHRREPVGFALQVEECEVDGEAQSSVSLGLTMAQGRVSSTLVASAPCWAFHIVAQIRAPVETRQLDRDCSSFPRSTLERLPGGSLLAQVCLPGSQIVVSSYAP